MSKNTNNNNTQNKQIEQERERTFSVRVNEIVRKFVCDVNWEWSLSEEYV